MGRFQAADAALATLAAAALGVSGAAASGWSPVSKGQPGASQTVAARSASATPSPSASSASATSTPTSSSTSATTSTASPSSTPATSTSAAPKPAPTPAAFPHLSPDRPSTIAVLGDSTSTDLGAWVNVLGGQLGNDRTARVQRLRRDGQGYAGAIRYGTQGAPLQIWNASRAGLSPELTPELVKKVMPTKPDVVLLSVGRDVKDPRAVPAQLTTTVASIKQAYPQASVAVALQPATTASIPAAAAVKQWATAQGLPMTDPGLAITRAKNSAELMDASGAVTDAGHQVWASTVYRALTGNPAPEPVGPAPRGQ